MARREAGKSSEKNGEDQAREIAERREKGRALLAYVDLLFLQVVLPVLPALRLVLEL